MFNLRFRVPIAIPLGPLVLGACLTGCGGGGSLSQNPPVPQSLPATAATRASALANLAPSAGAVSEASTNAYASLVLSDRPLSFYQLNDSSSRLVDSGPYGVAGTYGSAVSHGIAAITSAATSAAGFPGGTFYNPSGFAIAPPRTSLQPSTVTVEAWIRCSAHNTTSHELPIVVYGNALSGVRYGLFIHGLANTTSNTLLYEQNNAGQRMLRLYGATRLSAGVTYHVVAVSNGSQVTTYINGNVDQTTRYPGPISYASPIANGVQIGGAASNSTYGGPSFAGTISHVAVYGTALTSSQVVNHYLAGQLVTMVAESASAADSFVDSIGINTHFGAGGSIDTSHFSQASSLLISSGIRHIRDAMNFNTAAFASEMKRLASAGIHGDFVVPIGTSEANVKSMPSIVSPALEAFEPPNEPDDQVGQPYPSWVPGCIATQKNIYSWVKGNPATARYSVFGPGMAWAVSIGLLGNISADFDVANIHDYLSNYNPGNSYGPYVVSLGRATSSGKPLVVTETGYGTGTNSPILLDDRADVRYMTRLFLEYFKLGIMRTYSYDFIEIGGQSKFGQFGIVRPNLAPKAAYFGIKSLIDALQDPGAPFKPSALTYRISGFTSNVHHLLMQKRNGTFVLAVWIEAPGWNTYNTTGGDVFVPSQTVTLQTAARFSKATSESITDNGGLASSSISWNGNQATFPVTDSVSLITLSP